MLFHQPLLSLFFSLPEARKGAIAQDLWWQRAQGSGGQDQGFGVRAGWAVQLCGGVFSSAFWHGGLLLCRSILTICLVSWKVQFVFKRFKDQWIFLCSYYAHIQIWDSYSNVLWFKYSDTEIQSHKNSHAYPHHAETSQEFHLPWFGKDQEALLAMVISLYQ